MTIHHATKSAAAKIGATITEIADGDFTITNGKCTATGTDPVSLLAAFKIAAPALVEYSPHLALRVADGEAVILLRGEEFNGAGEDNENEPDLQQAIADALWVLSNTAAGDDDEGDTQEGSEEEEREVKSIVPLRYRNEYKARGDATRCGDELCQLLDQWCTIATPSKSGRGKPKRVSNIGITMLVAAANGATKTWDNLNKGQRSMNARNGIRAFATANGYIAIPSTVTGGEPLVITLSPEWMAAARDKVKVAA